MMAKVILVILVLAIVLVAIAGCGGENTPTPEEHAENAQEVGESEDCEAVFYNEETGEYECEKDPDWWK